MEADELPASVVICHRDLTWRNGDDLRTVRVAICAPVYKNGDFECSVEISGLGPEVDGIPEEDCNLDWRDQGWFGAITGYDSIQALEMAFKLVENKLKPMAPQL